MMNSFEKISQLKITASLSKTGDKTIIKDSFFTSPFKIMKPFERDDGGISVFQQTASAGVLAGDTQEHSFIIEDNAIFEIKSQSFEKIFKMDEGEKATRKIFAQVGKNATFIYGPLPCIPFEDSCFESESNIELSENSKLLYKDCITAGRKAFGEEFKFKKYQNRISIWKTENECKKLIFRDNTVFEGQKKSEKMKKDIFFGEFSHLGTMILIGFGLTSKKVNKILELPEKLLYLDNEESLNKIQIGVSDFGNGICVKILANSAEEIENIFNKLKKSVFMH